MAERSKIDRAAISLHREFMRRVLAIAKATAQIEDYEVWARQWGERWDDGGKMARQVIAWHIADQAVADLHAGRLAGKPLPEAWPLMSRDWRMIDSRLESLLSIRLLAVNPKNPVSQAVPSPSQQG